MNIRREVEPCETSFARQRKILKRCEGVSVRKDVCASALDG
jgi:hypothetical protein